MYKFVSYAEVTESITSVTICCIF